MTGFKGGKIPPAWIRDDITWCCDHACPVVGCMRNPKNMVDSTSAHSYAMFRDTDECPITIMERQADIERGDEAN